MTDDSERDKTGNDKSIEAQPPQASEPPLPQVPAVPAPPDLTREATGAPGAGGDGMARPAPRRRARRSPAP